MSEPLDIHAILQNGYFKTTRSRVDETPSPPRSISRPASRHSSRPSSPPKLKPRRDEYRDYKIRESPTHSKFRVRPPPPSVEDEAEALAKEFRSLGVEDPADDAIPSRGEIDQNPIFLEVHEHNPERRFVLIPTDDDAQGTTTKDGSDSPNSQEAQCEDALPKSPSKSPGKDRKYSPVFDDNNLAADERPAISRRKSRQDLPPINTSTRHERSPEHHRTKSSLDGRPNGPSSARPAPPLKDDLLSPDVIKTAGVGRRERAYYDYAVPTSNPRRMAHQRSYSNLGDERRRDKTPRRESLSPGHGGRSESNPDARKTSRRRPSNDRNGDFRHREEPARSSRRDTTTPIPRREDEAPASQAPRPRGPRPKDDEPVPTSRSSRRRGNSTSIHQDLDPKSSSEKEKIPRYDDRPRTREPATSAHVPLAAATAAAAAAASTDFPVNPRASATFPITRDEYKSGHLPYPDDTQRARPGRSPVVPGHAPPAASMPEMPMSVSPERSFEKPQPATPSMSQTTAWPPPFDPERDGAPTDHEVGSYRRFSEGRSMDKMPKTFPVCQRKEPVAGFMDWLTIPQSDFNICSECYQSVFADTEYRSQFQLMLRSIDKPIACDFGASPWYRIAYLLTLKNEHPDLRLFRQVNNVAMASKSSPCPGNRQALRNWYSVKDPYTRRMVPGFTVCHQCAKTVEALLPNLTGTFIPLDTRAEPLSSTCCLHFKPMRKRFALYFDTLETTAEKAIKKHEAPDISALAAKIERLSTTEECREDSPIPDAYWHTMQYLPEFTVCADCFDEVVKPKLGNNVIARNFYKDPRRLALSTCQLYSPRMREIFSKACRREDAKYLKAKVLERQQVEADIHSRLVKLDRERHDEPWVEEEVSKLIGEWKKWE